jgi:tripartite-type tricarboxylate transporter receptor subunit TctC
LSESGLPDFEVLNWQGLLAPAGTSPHILVRLHAALTRMNQDADAVARLRSMGYAPVFNTPAQFAAEIRQQTRHWTTIVKTAGLRVD